MVSGGWTCLDAYAAALAATDISMDIGVEAFDFQWWCACLCLAIYVEEMAKETLMEEQDAKLLGIQSVCIFHHYVNW